MLGIAHRTISVSFDQSKVRFSPRKSIPINPKTLGDYLLLKRRETRLSQPQMAVKMEVAIRTVRAWEHDQLLPTEIEFHQLANLLRVDSEFLRSKTQQRVP